MKALKNKKNAATKNQAGSGTKSKLKETAIQNQMEHRFAGHCRTGSFSLSSSAVYYQLFGDLIID